ncbi:hypothetical protein E1A91_A06G094100v1 [Gossypium mustelinum]|uniref:Glycosyl hydrolase family 32 N-terminal domain-containing protein n=1 Tax=Gossypium mustelinum TaxID=34275 RepID=A0A5D2YUX3_GOSMU|nr:hypothetical protein E1A91_A06G094100v1 [Gossypium mustelinum]
MTDLKLKVTMDLSVVLVVGSCFGLLGNGVQSDRHDEKLQSLPQDQPYRTGYHFQPPKNWMNGPMSYKGVYHLFYQYNPYAAVWGNITWAHSISYDLVNWIHLDIALSPDDPFDINGCWSGLTTFLSGGKPIILYTGGVTMNRQVQNLAEPKNLSDPMLREWVKSSHNPVITHVDGMDSENFRDPTTAWQGPDGLRRSKEPVHSSTRTGMWECPDFYPVSIDGKNGVDTSSLDKFRKHVLKASFNSSDHYVLGNYTAVTDNFSVDTDFLDNGSDLRYDYDNFYASKTFFDSAKKRRILWAWIQESDSTTDDVKKTGLVYSHFPRSILLSKTGKQLIQWPVEEIEKQRTVNVRFKNKELKGGSVLEISGITASQSDVEVSFNSSNLKEADLLDPSWVDPQLLCSQKTASVGGNIGPFGILVLASKDLTEQTSIFFRVFRSNEKYVVLMCSDQSRSSLEEGPKKTIYGAFIDIDPLNEMISLRSLIDHSIVESFGGEGRACITSRVYPKLAIDNQAYLYAFNNSTFDVNISTLNAWSMKKAQIVSFTKRRKPHLN